MFNLAITIAVRKLLRERLYVSISIGSLTIGIACSLIIALYLYSELTYDQSHKNHERIYRLSSTAYTMTMNGAGTETGPILMRENPEILDYVRFRAAPEQWFTVGDNSRVWEEIYLTDPSVFNVFTLNVIHGDKDAALDDPYSIAISESFAKHYFGDRNPVGEVINTERFGFRVSLVYEDMPENVQFKYDAILPFELMEVYSPGFPGSSSNGKYLAAVTTYLLVSDDFSPEVFDTIRKGYFETYLQSELPVEAGEYKLHAQLLTENYYSEPILDGGRTGNVATVYTLAGLAVFLLLMACINYINLTTARAGKRLLEIGMRKVLGASRSQLIVQLLCESFVYCTVSLLAGILLAVCVLELSLLDELVGKSELLTMLSRPPVALLVLVLWITVSLVAGLYPALHLARTRVMSSLKPAARMKQLPGVREVLVVFQLVISCCIIICVLIMQNQVHFVLNAPLGFETKDKLTVRLRGADVIEQIGAIRQQLLQSGSVRAVATAGFAPGQGLAMSITEVESNDGVLNTTMTHPLNIEPDFLTVMDIDVIAGRGFSSLPDEKELSYVMVSEALVRQMDWDQPLGKRIGRGEVIGVFRDIHYQSLHEPIGPLVLWPLNSAPNAFSSLSESARAQLERDLIIAVTDDLSAARRDILEVLSRFTSGRNLELRSLEDSWLRFYQDDVKAARLVSIFAGISIFISLLGLIGLTSYAAEQRSKELAIRKVLGASVGQTLLLLSRHAMLALALAIVPASLLSLYLMQIWLSRFTYTDDVTVAPFIWAFLLIAAISLTTVVLQSWRTVTGNPVERLRYE
ncbi:MAG: ABC transporter permease [Gammaproteobacteria bacterium]|nr:ABC transporter permease [Gammaproteobacteria bacterium]